MYFLLPHSERLQKGLCNYFECFAAWKIQESVEQTKGLRDTPTYVISNRLALCHLVPIRPLTSCPTLSSTMDSVCGALCTEIR